MAYLVMVHATFDNLSDAEHIYNQSKAVATKSSVAKIGEVGERSSHTLVLDEDTDEILERWYLDLFGIVREGEMANNDNAPTWIQPSGAQDAYPLTNVYGEPTRVTHNGVVWENTVNDNVWQPGAYGWTEV